MKDRDFQVGDKATSLIHGEGEVIHIEEYALQPIEVKCKTGQTTVFTKEGYYVSDDTRRCLYHGHNLKIDIQEKNPVRHQWVNVYMSKYGAKPSEGPSFGTIRATKESCLNHIDPTRIYVDTIQLKPFIKEEK